MKAELRICSPSVGTAPISRNTLVLPKNGLGKAEGEPLAKRLLGDLARTTAENRRNEHVRVHDALH